MSSVVISGDSSGTITLAAPALAGTNTITMPAVTGTMMVNGPAFSAYQSTAQTLTANVSTKLQFQTKEYDTNNNFDNVTNYRFTPTVSGYYQVSACITFSTTNTTLNLFLYKNGVLYKNGQAIASNGSVSSMSALVFCNGSTDYIEIYGSSGVTQNLSAAINSTYFQAVMVRSA
jgi:hypothetical protein